MKRKLGATWRVTVALLLVLALLPLMAGPAGAVVGVSIDSPTNAAPAYIAPPGYITVDFTFTPEAATADVDIEVYKGATVIGTKSVSYTGLDPAVTGESVGTTDGSGDFTGSLAVAPIVAGSVSLTIGAETFTDDGVGGLTGSIAGTGTINYTTGALTVTGAPLTTAITADYYPSNPQSEPVYITAAAADGTYDLSVSVDDTVTPLSATEVDAVIVDRTAPTVTIATSVDVVGEPVGTTDGSGDFTGSLTYTPIVAGSLTMSDGTNTYTDDGAGVLTGAPAGSGTITYATGAVTITGGAASGAVTADYTASTVHVVINENVDTFNVIATFSKPMAAGVPTISFVPDVTSAPITLTFSSGAWSAGDTVYTATYDVTDNDVEIADVDVSVGGATDQAGNPQDPNPTIAADLFDVDTVAPTLASIAWGDVDDSRGINAGDTLLFTFSQAVDTTTVTAVNTDTALPLTGTGTTYGTTGLLVDWATPVGDNTLTVTLGAEVDIVDDDTVTPASTVTDVAGNTATGTQSIQDNKGPKLASITWWDLDASTTINAGDELVFLFSEDMDTATVTAGTLSADLPLSAGSYGTGATVAWTGLDVVTVTLGAGADIATGATVDPAATVTDIATPANPDDTVPATGIVQGVIVSIEAPATVLPGAAFTAEVTITYVTDLDAGDFAVTFDPAVLDLTSVTDGLINGSAVPVPAFSADAGTVTVAVNVSGTLGVSGEGILAVLNFVFSGFSGEDSELHLVAGTLSDKDAQAINATWVDPDPALTVAATLVVGDATGDGSLNIFDITQIELDVAAGLTVWTAPGVVGEATPGADANVDTSINALDITRVELLVAGP